MIKIAQSFQNNMMASSWRHFEFKKLVSLTNNTPSFTSVELLVGQKSNFEKINFKAIPHDTWWRHQAKTPQISCYYEGDYVYQFLNNYHKLCHRHSRSVFWDEFNLPLEGALTFSDVIGIFFLNQTFAKVVLSNGKASTGVHINLKSNK